MSPQPPSYNKIALLEYLHNLATDSKVNFDRYINTTFETTKKLISFDSAWLSVIELEKNRVVFIGEDYLFNYSDKLVDDSDVLPISDRLKKYHTHAIVFHHCLSIAAQLAKESNQYLVLKLIKADPNIQFQAEEIRLFEDFFFPVWFCPMVARFGFYHVRGKPLSTRTRLKLKKTYKFNEKQIQLLNLLFLEKHPLTYNELAKRLIRGKKAVEHDLYHIYWIFGLSNGEGDVGKKKMANLIEHLKKIES